MITEQEREDRAAMQALNEVAEGVRKDIEGDFPGVDTAFDLYVDRIEVDGTQVLVGVVDMGDVYQGSYAWSGGTDGAWEPEPRIDPQAAIDKIMASRR